MTTATSTNDRLAAADTGNFSTAWDWKGSYLSGLKTEGYERFSQFSATPDTTVLYAGPARFTGLSSDASVLKPVGLADQIGVQSNPALARLFEIGSNRSFFTRGKTVNAISLGRMLADQSSILATLTENAYRTTYIPTSEPGSVSPNADIMMNLDSEYFGVPFGLMMLFKTRGGGTEGEGKPLTAIYLEYCMFSNYNFQVSSSSPVIVESVGIEFDRILPVSLN